MKRSRHTFQESGGGGGVAGLGVAAPGSAPGRSVCVGSMQALPQPAKARAQLPACWSTRAPQLPVVQAVQHSQDCAGRECYAGKPDEALHIAGNKIRLGSRVT